MFVSGEGTKARPWALLALVLPMAAGALVSAAEAAARPALAAFGLCCISLLATSLVGVGAALLSTPMFHVVLLPVSLCLLSGSEVVRQSQRLCPSDSSMLFLSSQVTPVYQVTNCILIPCNKSVCGCACRLPYSGPVGSFTQQSGKSSSTLRWPVCRCLCHLASYCVHSSRCCTACSNIINCCGDWRACVRSTAASCAAIGCAAHGGRSAGWAKAEEVIGFFSWTWSLSDFILRRLTAVT